MSAFEAGQPPLPPPPLTRVHGGAGRQREQAVAGLRKHPGLLGARRQVVGQAVHLQSGAGAREGGAAGT